MSARDLSELGRLARLLDHLHQGVVAVKPDLTIAFANRAARELLEAGRLEEGAAVPDPWPGFSVPDFVRAVFMRGESQAEVMLDADRTESRAIKLAGTTGDDGGAAIVILSDASEHDRRERAQRDFVTNAAHELQTPLTAILGAVEVLQAGAKDDPAESARFLAHIDREARRLSKLAQALLILARAQAVDEQPSREAIDLPELLAVVARSLGDQMELEIAVECAPGLVAMAHGDLVEQALVQLVTNAVKHAGRGPVVLAGLAAEAGTVAVEVRDSGPGIPVPEHERIFERFYRGTGDSAGFGLGLAIVRQIAAVLDGELAVSTDGSGTIVRLTLPRVT